MPGQGNVIFNGMGMANVLGLSAMVEKYRVTMDTAVENAFLVHHTDGIIKFKCTPEGLYAYNPTQGFYDEVAAYKAKEKTVKFQAIETVKDNMKGYTQQQITAAKKARDLYRHLPRNIPSSQVHRTGRHRRKNRDKVR